jgi:hypothetical protein
MMGRHVVERVQVSPAQARALAAAVVAALDVGDVPAARSYAQTLQERLDV